MDTLSAYFSQLISDNEINTSTAILRIILSLILGVVIGAERQLNRHNAGLRTITLICIGSTIAMLLSIYLPQTYPDFLNGDPGRIAAQVVSGVGFLGAGAIIHGRSRGNVQGLTTAACIWQVAAIGLAVGAGFYAVSIFATLITLFVLVVVDKFEYRIFSRGSHKRLFVRCSSASPDIENLKTVLRNDGVLVRDTTFYSDFDKQTTNVTFAVYIKNTVSTQRICESLRSIDTVYAVGIIE